MLRTKVMRENELHLTASSNLAVPRLWDSQHRWLTIGLVLTVVGAAFEALAVATILPATIDELGGVSLYGWAFSAFLLTNLIGITVAAGESDRLGPARPFLVGVVLFVIGLVMSGLAPTMSMLIAGRTIQGFGAGVIGSIAYIAIARGYPAELKPQMLAVLSSAWVVPGLIGPGLAAIVADTVGWRWVFLGLAPIMVVAGGLAVPSLARIDGNAALPRHWRKTLAALGVAVGAGMLLNGIGSGSGLQRGVVVSSGCLLSVLALQYLLPKGTLRVASALPAAIVASGLLNMAFFGVDAFVPLALTEIRGQSATRAGLALTAATIMWTTGAWLQARLAPRHSRRLLVWTGLLIAALGIAAVTAILHPGVPALLASVAWGLAGLGMGLAYSTLSLVVLESAQPGQEGEATGGLQLLNVLGSALGTGVGGAFIARAHAQGDPAGGILMQNLLMAGMLGLAVIVARRLPYNRPDGAADLGTSQKPH